MSDPDYPPLGAAEKAPAHAQSQDENILFNNQYAKIKEQE